VDRNPEAPTRAAWLAAAYPGRSIDEGHIASWAEVLAPLTTTQIEDVIAMLRFRAPDPPSVAQMRDCIAEVRKQTMSPALTSGGHTYIEQTECPVCLVVHGEELDPGQTAHGLRHLGDGDFGRASHPDECDCGFTVPPNHS